MQTTRNNGFIAFEYTINFSQSQGEKTDPTENTETFVTKTVKPFAFWIRQTLVVANPGDNALTKEGYSESQ